MVRHKSTLADQASTSTIEFSHSNVIVLTFGKNNKFIELIRQNKL